MPLPAVASVLSKVLDESAGQDLMPYVSPCRSIRIYEDQELPDQQSLEVCSIPLKVEVGDLLCELKG